LAAGVLVFAAVGWYLGWYKLERASAPDGHRSYNFDLNEKQIEKDLQRGKERLQKALESSSKEDSGKTSESKPGDSGKQDSKE
jgi:hypothetical protein